MASDKIDYNSEIKRIHIKEIIEEANKNFTLASQREEAITLNRRGQVRLIDLM